MQRMWQHHVEPRPLSSMTLAAAGTTQGTRGLRGSTTLALPRLRLATTLRGSAMRLTHSGAASSHM